MGKLMRRGWGSALLAAGGLLLTSAGAQAATCDYTWGGSSGGDWMAAANWAGDAVPIAGSNVCIASGSADLKDTGANAPHLGSLSVSGSAGLTVQIHQVLVSASTTIGPSASLTLNGTYYGSNAGNASLGGGTILNQGTITLEGTGYSATLYGTVTNQGTIDVPYGSEQLGQGDNGGTGSLVNEGTINIAAANPSYPNDPATLTALGYPITNTSGTINNQGSFTIVGANGTTGSFNQGAGSVTGNAIVLARSSSLTWSGAGASSFYVGPCDGAIPMSGNIASGQKLTVAIGTGVEESSSFSSAGKILLDDTYLGSGCGETSILTDSGTFTNTGTITVQGGGTPFLSGAVVNQGTMTVVPGTALAQSTGSFTNAASGTLAPEISSSNLGSFVFDSGTSFNAGGTLAPTLEGGFTPTKGQEFKVIAGAGLHGTFASVSNGFGADYSQSGAIQAVYGATSSAGGSTGGGGGSSNTPASAAVSGLSGGKGVFTIKLSCPSGAGACALITFKATVTEYLKRGKVTAVTAAKRKPATKVVTIASGALTNLVAGTAKTVTLKLNATGLRLLKRRHSLLSSVTVSEGGKLLRRSTIRVSQPAKK